ncbi:MAG: tRNA (adenosine(37)-N6)-threonylcarbamoyltransferase complex transferase subunit TsaD [Microgenomates group bacterium]
MTNINIKKGFTILAIDTSCDETSVAITEDDKVLVNIVSSQIKYHQKYGGVVPHLARQIHQKFLPLAIKEALKRGGKKFKDINSLAVTIGPGLAPALEVGIAEAKKLAHIYQLPIIAVNHMEAHLLSSFAKNSKGKGGFSPVFPIIGLLVSGGHTQLVLMKNFGDYKLLGETVDDAAGEAFDKVAKMLNLGYPGGPIISQLAKEGKPKYQLPIPMIKSGDLNFSFSGLKTACLYFLEKIPEEKKNRQFICDFCASFEKTVALALAIKLEMAIKKYHPHQIVLGGGVINNLTIRKEIRKVAKKFNLKVFIPYTSKLLTDNAGMIGVCAWYQAKKGDFVKDIKKLDRLPNLNFK